MMNSSNFDTSCELCGVTPFPEEAHELALVLYEKYSVEDLLNRLKTDVEKSDLEKWNLTIEQVREEILLAISLNTED